MRTRESPGKNCELALKKWTYKSAGVNIVKVSEAHKVVRDLFSDTLNFRKGSGSVYKGVGHYAGLLRMGNKRLLAIHADNVGTKVLVAQMMRKYDTVGIDCVAMNVNDVVCVGAEPFAFVDYIALKAMNEKLVAEISKGLASGAKIAKIAVVGGETAILPDLLRGNESAFDLAGTCVGFVDEDKVILGQNLRVGDAIIGVESSGIHSNGLTLARKVLLAKHSVTDKIPGTNLKIGEEMLNPTRIYCQEVISLLKQGFKITGLAHITGGAFTKLKRISPSDGVGFSLERMPSPHEIFVFIQSEGKISKQEMYRTFNMGVGFCIFSPQSDAKRIVETLHDEGLHSLVIGRVVGEHGVYLDKKPL